MQPISSQSATRPPSHRNARPRVVECASSERIWGRSLRTRRHPDTLEYTTSDGCFVSAQLHAYGLGFGFGGVWGAAEPRGRGGSRGVARAAPARVQRVVRLSAPTREPTPPPASTPGDVNAAERLLRIIHPAGATRSSGCTRTIGPRGDRRLRAENAELRAANERLSPVAAAAAPVRARPPSTTCRRSWTPPATKDGTVRCSSPCSSSSARATSTARCATCSPSPSPPLTSSSTSPPTRTPDSGASRVVNPERARIDASGCGMVTRQHASNIATPRRWASRSSTWRSSRARAACLWGAASFERHVATHRFSAIPTAREREGVADITTFDGWAGAWWSSVFNGLKHI